MYTADFPISFWVGFLTFVFVALALDLGVFHRKPKALTFRESATMTGVWVMLASLFCTFIFYEAGSKYALEFLTGYVVELSLSMDNVFVIALIFSYFKIPQIYQHRVLFWGIMGAIVMRFIMITLGIKLIESFTWIFYAFGLLLIVSGIKIVITKDDHDEDLANNLIITFCRKHFRITKDLHEEKFWVKIDRKWYATPLFLVLLLVEKTDLIFAVDSIPAILAITQNPFIVFTSNIFAILGLRALYFMLANMIHKFAYLKYGLCGILVFIGVKMLIIPHGIKIPTPISLAVVLLFLGGSIAYSFYVTSRQKA